MGRGISHIAAVLLLILVAIGAVILVYLHVAGMRPRQPKAPCTFTIAAVKEETGRVGTAYYGYALRAWVSPSPRCKLQIDVAYLRYPDGSLAAVLHPIPPGIVINETGGLQDVMLYPDRQLPGGDYVLVLPSRGLDPSYSLRLNHPLAGSVILTGSLEELNGTTAELGGARVVVNVTVYEQQFNTYKITVRVCAKPGHWVYYDRIMVLNASLEPPVYVGQWYVFEESEKYLPFTYPDCSIADFYPVLGDEQPFTIVASAYTG